MRTINALSKYFDICLDPRVDTPMVTPVALQGGLKPELVNPADSVEGNAFRWLR